jgi:hypothetical protein
MNYSSLFNRPQRAAARSRRTRLRRSACCSNAIRSAGAINSWVGRTQAAGHRVIPLDRINSTTGSRSSLTKSSMFHTRAAGSVSQSLWLHLGVSPKILVKTEHWTGFAPVSAGASTLLLDQSLVNERVSKIFSQFCSLEKLSGCSTRLPIPRGIRVISLRKAGRKESHGCRIGGDVPCARGPAP